MTLSELKTNLFIQKGRRDQLTETMKIESEKVDTYEKEASLCDKARSFLLVEIEDRRSDALTFIEEIGTDALSLVYGDLKLEFDSEGKSLEMRLSAPYKNERVVTGLMGSSCGGAIETLAYALRFPALSWAGYDGPCIFDEAFHFMSEDEKIETVASLVKRICDETGRQVIYATHKLDAFGDKADKIIKIVKKEGISKCDYSANPEKEGVA